jgi:uncharacterized protein
MCFPYPRHMREVVYIVAKAPLPGESKSRLCPPLLPSQAASLAAAFLRDTIALVARASVDVRLICRHEQERALLTSYAGETATVHVQEGSDVGAAMETAFRQGLANGYEAVGVIGTDTPDLPPSAIREAFDALARGADLSLGQSEDGGYYFLAAKAVYPALFRDMAWSTASVAQETLRRCHALGLEVHHSVTWTDVDDAASLDRLRQSVTRCAASVARHTRAALRDLPSLAAP